MHPIRQYPHCDGDGRKALIAVTPVSLLGTPVSAPTASTNFAAEWAALQVLPRDGGDDRHGSLQDRLRRTRVLEERSQVFETFFPNTVVICGDPVFCYPSSHYASQLFTYVQANAVKRSRLSRADSDTTTSVPSTPSTTMCLTPTM